MDLYIVRHAIAFERDEEKWPGDRDRPLTEKGAKRFRRVARGFQRVLDAPEVVLTSPLARAAETAEILARHGGWPAPTPLEALEPGRPAAEVVEALRPYYGDTTRVAVVGHEPDLSRLATFLLTGIDTHSIFDLKKGGVAALRFEEEVRPGAATLRWLLTPGIVLDLT